MTVRHDLVEEKSGSICRYVGPILFLLFISWGVGGSFFYVSFFFNLFVLLWQYFLWKPIFFKSNNLSPIELSKVIKLMGYKYTKCMFYQGKQKLSIWFCPQFAWVDSALIFCIMYTYRLQENLWNIFLIAKKLYLTLNCVIVSKCKKSYYNHTHLGL